MKQLKAFKIFFLFLLIASFATQSIKSTTVDVAPVYINDGYNGLLKDLYSALSSDFLSQTDSIKGRCFFTFVISKEGTIEAETIKLAHKTILPDEYVNAVKDAIKQLGKFKPGGRYNSKTKRWEPLRAHYYISVFFPIPAFLS